MLVGPTGGYVSVTFDVPAVPTLAATLSADKTSYLTNQTASVTARVTANGAPAAGASVSLTVTLPNGQQRSFSGVSDAAGQARFAIKIGKRDPRGTWHLAGAATASGASSTAATTFIVQ